MPKARIVKIDFGKDASDDMWKHVEDQTEYWLRRTRNYRENTLKEYARLYKGTPFDELKNTPWPNAANNVIQVIATHSDQLLARVMAIYMTEPLWSFRIFGDLDEPDNGNEQREVLEQFLNDAAMNPEELDLYRIEQAWFSSAIRNGTGIIKLPWEYCVEDQLVTYDAVDDTAFKHRFDKLIKYDNPRPVNVPLNKFVNNLNFNKLEDSNFKFEIVTVSKYQLLERKELGIFDADDIDSIIGQPDRSGRAALQQYIDYGQGITESAGEAASDEYDLIECWFTWWHNGNKLSICAIHHPRSKTRLIAFYNYYPRNMCIYEDAKLAYDDDNYLGYGFAEMLKGYQEEISTTHNQRTDAGTLNNTTAFRVNKNSKLHSILTFYPGVMVPADEGEIERLDTSNPHASDTQSEMLTGAYAKERSGIDPATGGTGGGVVNSKRGIYSSQGTFAVLQQQNNRTSLRTSDMRSAHVRAGAKFTDMYSYFGLGSKLRSYGQNADKLKKALENVRNRKLGLLIRPSSASINKEVEKQNDILLSQTLERLYAGDAQIIQSLTTAGMPDELKQYYIEVLKAKNQLMKTIIRNFGHDDINRLIPVPAFLKETKNARSIGSGAQTQQPSPNMGGAGGLQAPNQGQGEGQGMLPVGGWEDSNRVPTQ